MADISLDDINAELDRRESQPWTLPRADKVNFELKSRFEDMAMDFYDMTGTPLRVTDSYRTNTEQHDLKKRKPYLAATPGRSRHEVGEALDIDQDQIAKFGQDNWTRLLDKHGFTRPALSKGEHWHIELPRFERASKIAGNAGQKISLQDIDAELQRRGIEDKPQFSLEDINAELQKRGVAAKTPQEPNIPFAMPDTDTLAQFSGVGSNLDAPKPNLVVDPAKSVVIQGVGEAGDTLAQFSAPAGEMVGQAMDLPFVPLRKGLELFHQAVIEPSRERTIQEWANAMQSGADQAAPEAFAALPSKEAFVPTMEFALAPAYLKMISKSIGLLGEVGKAAFHSYAPDAFFKYTAKGGMPVPYSPTEVQERLMSMTGSERAEMVRKYPQFREVMEEIVGAKKGPPIEEPPISAAPTPESQTPPIQPTIQATLRKATPVGEVPVASPMPPIVEPISEVPISPVPEEISAPAPPEAQSQAMSNLTNAVQDDLAAQIKTGQYVPTPDEKAQGGVYATGPKSTTPQVYRDENKWWRVQGSEAKFSSEKAAQKAAQVIAKNQAQTPEPPQVETSSPTQAKAPGTQIYPEGQQWKVEGDGTYADKATAEKAAQALTGYKPDPAEIEASRNALAKERGVKPEELTYAYTQNKADGVTPGWHVFDYALEGGKKTGWAQEIGKAGPAQGGGKEPWEMTQREHAAETLRSQVDSPDYKYTRLVLDKGHKIEVEQALSRGDKVPAKVLVEYPDLAKKSAPTPLTEKAGLRKVDPLDTLIEQYNATGRTATRYPKKKAVSVDGRTMTEKAAALKMKDVVGKGGASKAGTDIAAVAAMRAKFDSRQGAPEGLVSQETPEQAQDRLKTELANREKRKGADWQAAVEKNDLAALVHSVGGITPKSVRDFVSTAEERQKLGRLILRKDGFGVDVLLPELKAHYPDQFAHFEDPGDLVRYFLDGRYEKFKNKKGVSEADRILTEQIEYDRKRLGLSDAEFERFEREAEAEVQAETEYAARELEAKRTESASADTSWESEPALDLPGGRPKASKIESRLNELQVEYPDLDAKHLEIVLKTFPDGPDDQIIRMAKDPKVFDQLRRQRLQKMSDSGGDSHQMQSLPGTGGLFGDEGKPRITGLDTAIEKTSTTIDDFADTTLKVGLATQDISRLQKANDDLKVPGDQRAMSDDPEVERRYRAAKGLTRKGMLVRMQKHIADAKENFKHVPGLSKAEDAKVITILRRFEAIPEYSQAMSAHTTAGILAGLGPKKYDVFTRNLILDDLIKDIDNGLYEGKSDLPFGYKDRGAVERDLEKFKKLAAANPDIQAALERRQKFNEVLKAELISRDLLPEEVKDDPRYFHHQVLMYMDAQRKGLSSGDVRLHKKGWQKGRKGSGLDFNTEYIEAEHQYISQAIAQIKTHDILQEIKAATAITVKKGDPLPDGYVAWQPKPGTIWYRTASVPQKVIDEVIAGNRSLTAEDFKTIVAMGQKRPAWTIPDRVAQVLDNFRDFDKDEGFDRFVRATMATWKQWTLINPVRVLKYNLNNMSGDLDIALAYDPRILKYFRESAEEAWGYHKGKAMTRDMREALEYGVISSGFSIQEIPDIKDIGLFRVLLADKPNIIEKFWEKSKGLTQARENILRIAAYKYFRDEIGRGKSPYGASDPKMVDAESDPKKKAALLARDLIGDYGNLSKAGQWLRTHMIPFFSWMEINTPRYIRLFRSASREGRAAGAGARIAGVGAKKLIMGTAKVAIQALMLYGLVSLWNEAAVRVLGLNDDEKRRLFENRHQLHLILGRRQDGTVLSIRFQGAFSDVLDWVGLGDPLATIHDIQEGKKSAKEIGKDMAMSAPNKIVNASHPFIKTGLEVLTGQSLFPDISKPRPIRDKAEHVARLWSLNLPYQYLTGKPTRGIRHDLTGMVLYSNDTGEAAYWTAKRLEYRFMDKQGMDRPTATPTDKSNALYYWKQARRFGDQKAALKYLKEYVKLGGTTQGAIDSIERGYPEKNIPLRLRSQFKKTLSTADMRDIQAAKDWYKSNMKLKSEDFVEIKQAIREHRATKQGK
ncbi:MAG: hypothetical protein WC593_15025 [Methanoregula sp.]